MSKRNRFAQSVVSFMAELRAGAREGREIENRYYALSRLSATDLAKVGLTRWDIGRAALKGR